MADQEEARPAPSRTLAMLSLPSTARAPATVRAAVEGIALACVPQPDVMLRALLIDAIGACAPWARRDVGPGAPLDRGAWAAACSLTGTAAAL